jgi:hypothetical protein
MYFLVQVKRTNGTVEKGVVVKETLDEVQQSYHAYLGAYAYGKDKNTDYVLVHILNSEGLGLKGEVWEKAEPIEE